MLIGKYTLQYYCIDNILLCRINNSLGENGVLIKERVNIECWNKLLLKNHLYKGMLWFEDGKVCIIFVF